MEKGVLELCRAATIKPKKIECSGFFYWTRTNSSLQTGLRSNRVLVPEKSQFFNRGWLSNSIVLSFWQNLWWRWKAPRFKKHFCLIDKPLFFICLPPPLSVICRNNLVMVNTSTISMTSTKSINSTFPTNHDQSYNLARTTLQDVKSVVDSSCSRTRDLLCLSNLIMCLLTAP